MGRESKMKVRWPPKGHCGCPRRRMASGLWKESGGLIGIEVLQRVGSWECVTGQSPKGITSRFCLEDIELLTELIHHDPDEISFRGVKSRKQWAKLRSGGDRGLLSSSATSLSYAKLSELSVYQGWLSEYSRVAYRNMEEGYLQKHEGRIAKVQT